MRKKAEHSVTKDKLMNAAQSLILARGFSGTSVDDVCASAGVTKGSFFHYFRSKDKLGEELLDRYCGMTQKGIQECCCPEAESDPLKRIYKLIDLMIEKAKARKGSGCLLGCMSQELSDSHPFVHKIADKAFSGMEKGITEDLKAAKKLHAPKADFKPSELAAFFVAILQGSTLLSKVRKDPKLTISGLQHFKKYLHSLYR